jgi:hypothetical protein
MTTVKELEKKLKINIQNLKPSQFQELINKKIENYFKIAFIDNNPVEANIIADDINNLFDLATDYQLNYFSWIDLFLIAMDIMEELSHQSLNINTLKAKLSEISEHIKINPIDEGVLPPIVIDCDKHERIKKIAQDLAKPKNYEPTIKL